MFGRFHILCSDAGRFEHHWFGNFSVKSVGGTIRKVLQNLDTKEALRNGVAILIHFFRVEHCAQLAFGLYIFGRIKKGARIFRLFQLFELNIIAK